MYVMRNVLGWRKMGALFAVMGIAAAVGTGALIQSNAIAQTLGEEGVPLLLAGILVTVMAAAGDFRRSGQHCQGLQRWYRPCRFCICWAVRRCWFSAEPK